MSLLLAYICSVCIYASFILLIVMNMGFRLKQISLKYLCIRIGGMTLMIYSIQYFQNKSTFLGNLLTSIGYLFVIFIIGSYLGENFFKWLAGVTGDKPGSLKDE